MSNMNLNAKEEKKFRAYVSEIRKMEKEKEAVAEDIKETYAALKLDGFEPSDVRHAVKEMKEREKDPDKYDEREARRDAYKMALGLI